jgi:hypothetical protein
MALVGLVIGLFVAYCALLATYAVWRELTLTDVQKVLRTVYVWLAGTVSGLVPRTHRPISQTLSAKFGHIGSDG